MRKEEDRRYFVIIEFLMKGEGSSGDVVVRPKLGPLWSIASPDFESPL
jgi:hypothetical protein